MHIIKTIFWQFCVICLLSHPNIFLSTTFWNNPIPYSSSGAPDHHTAARTTTIFSVYVAAIGTAWSLLGPPRNGQAALSLFQKHFLCWQYINSFRNCGRLRNWWETLSDVYAAPLLFNLLPRTGK